MIDRPQYHKWRRKLGGWKTCPAPGCRHRNPTVARDPTRGKPFRPKACLKCGAELPRKITFPARPKLAWYVREFNPATGRTRDMPCDSSEAADRKIEELKSMWSADPVKAQAITDLAGLVRSMEPGLTPQQIQDRLMDALKMNASISPKLWNEAVEEIAGEMLRSELKSPLYVEDVKRCANDFAIITGIEDCSGFRVEMVRQYRQTLQAGGWKRGEREARPMSAHGVAKCLATLRGFVTRAAAPERRWIHPSILDEAGGVWRQAKPDTLNPYMPDEDFVAIVNAMPTAWWRALILTIYNGALRRDEALRLRWEDVDLQGTKRLPDGIQYPHMTTDNQKSNRGGKRRPKITPLNAVTVAALRELRDQPDALCPAKYPATLKAAKLGESPLVFPVLGYSSASTQVSTQFASMVMAAGLVVKDEAGKAGPKWTLHSIRAKANEDVGRAGGSLREQMALCGHKTAAVNIQHYQSADPRRLQELVGRMSAFEALGRKLA